MRVRGVGGPRTGSLGGRGLGDAGPGRPSRRSRSARAGIGGGGRGGGATEAVPGPDGGAPPAPDPSASAVVALASGPAAPAPRLSVAGLVYLRGRDADARLRALEAQRARVRPVLGALAGRLRASRGWRALGFRSLSDYARERLGVGARVVSEWARVWEALTELPRLRAAVCSSEISWTVARLVVGVATPVTDAACLATVRGRTVRAVEALVAAWRAARDAEAGGQCVPQGGGATELESGRCVPSGVSQPDVTSGQCVPDPATRADEEPGDAATESGDASPRVFPVALTTTELPEGEERVGVRLACAPAVAAKWQEAVELARRTAGAQLPVWACAEWIAAEVTSALPPEGAAGAEASRAGAVAARDLGKEGRGADCAPHGRQPPAPTDREPGLRHWAFPHVRWAAPRVGAPSPEAEGEPGSDLAAVAERRARGGRHEPDGPTEESASHAHPELAALAEGLEACGPHELDRRLRAALAFLQGLDQELGRILRQVGDRRLYSELGFESFARYVGERLDLAPRTARRLVRLARAEHTAPPVADAFRAGRITALQAEAILGALSGRVPRPPAPDPRLPEVEALGRARGRLEPELAWLALAEGTTLRRLEREAGAEPRRAVAFHAPPEVAAFFRETLERVRRLLARRPAEGAASHRGRAPDHLLFELGVRPDGPPLARYRSGDVLVEGPA